MERLTGLLPGGHARIEFVDGIKLPIELNEFRMRKFVRRCVEWVVVDFGQSEFFNQVA